MEEKCGHCVIVHATYFMRTKSHRWGNFFLGRLVFYLFIFKLGFQVLWDTLYIDKWVTKYVSGNLQQALNCLRPRRKCLHPQVFLVKPLQISKYFLNIFHLMSRRGDKNSQETLLSENFLLEIKRSTYQKFFVLNELVIRYNKTWCP